MATTYEQGLVLLLLVASMWAIVAANNWRYGFNYTDWAHKRGSPPPPCNYTSAKIIVGGSQNWSFGTNYTDWARKNGPFYLNDTLVFKYDPPSDSNQHPHSVYLLPNIGSYLKCDLTRAKMVANESQGAGDGFQFVLKRWQPHYFACGASNGFHCNSGMKFFVVPWPRPWRY